jgi:hypothetical protein
VLAAFNARPPRAYAPLGPEIDVVVVLAPLAGAAILAGPAISVLRLCHRILPRILGNRHSYGEVVSKFKVASELIAGFLARW